ncbi:KAP family P-loop NTPase fold protein [Brucella pseudogrignonensis]|uniref:KAP family P-loop NTPase fold protein n=1 Tax=Brucella pseudogrignonensis TaxID=419475 RepID=UPI003ECF333E
MVFSAFFRFATGERKVPKDIGTTEIGADVPIKASDQDLLRRVGFAERIAVILSELTLEEGRVFAIRGQWGAGKTSLKNLVIEQLGSRKGSADWMDFNPWQWGDGEAIAKALFQQIADKIGGALSSKAGKRAAMFRRYGSTLTGSAGSVQKLGANAPLITLVLANASIVALAASIGWSLPEAATVARWLTVASIALPVVGWLLLYFGKDRWAEPVDKIRADLESSLRGSEKPLVIFVDDIDRLEPEQIRSLIRQIKVNANLPNIVFVLLFQPSIVERALDPIANGQGREFLKKIVQANFDLPAVSKSMVHSIMTKDLEQLMGIYAVAENGFEVVRWGNALVGAIQPYIENLRDARRYVSSVAIHLPLHTGRQVMEVNVVDFLVLEALRVFEPELHFAIFRDRDLFLQNGRFRDDRADNDNRSRIKEHISSLDPQRQSLAEAAVKQLFPKTEWAFGGSHYGDDWLRSWNSAKRVCTVRYFSRYFELQTPQGEMSENEFSDLLKISGEGKLLNEAIKNVESRELLGSLASRLDDSVETLPTATASVFLPAMFEIAQKLFDRNATPFGSPWTSAWRAISWYIDRLPKEERGALTLAAFRSTKALSVAAIIIHLNDPESQDEGSRIEPKLERETVQEMKAEWVRQIRERATTPDKLLEDSDLGSLLYRWKDYTNNSEEPRNWVQATVKTDDAFVTVLKRLMTTGTSHTMGDFVSRSVESIRLDIIEDFLGIGTARRRLATLKRPADELGRRAVDALAKALSGTAEH